MGAREGGWGGKKGGRKEGKCAAKGICGSAKG